MGQKTHEMPNDKRNDETGRFERKHEKTDFLTALQDLGGEAGTQAVADETGAPYSTAYHYLDKLAAEGEVERTKAAVGNANLWSVGE